MIQMVRMLSFALVLIFISGCAQKQRSPVSSKTEQANWLAHAEVVEQIDTWTLKAKMGLRKGEEATSFNMQWTEGEEDFNIRLSGPLGQGTVRVYGMEGRVVMEDGDNRQVAKSLDELWSRNSNLQIPLEFLKYWIRGIPHPDSKAGIKLNGEGLVEQLIQADWQVEYTSYHTEEPRLPRKLVASSQDKSAKVVIKNWDLTLN